MSDALQPSSTTASGTNVVESSAADAALLECHACGTKQQPIRLCCNCHSVGFCSLMCERTAWDSGHSRVCERPQPQPLLQPRIGSVEAAHAGSSAEELKNIQTSEMNQIKKDDIRLRLHHLILKLYKKRRLNSANFLKASVLLQSISTMQEHQTILSAIKLCSII